MNGSPKPTVPHAGDVVIYKRGHSGGVYVLSAFQHASQLTTFHTYDDAIRDAAAFADMNHVNAWYTPDGQTYRSVARYRREQTLVHAAA